MVFGALKIGRILTIVDNSNDLVPSLLFPLFLRIYKISAIENCGRIVL